MTSLDASADRPGLLDVIAAFYAEHTVPEPDQAPEPNIELEAGL